jgi:hypothetical protein
MRIKLPVFLFLIFLSNAIYGQKIVTDRPSQTASSTTIPQGSFQIESALQVRYAEVNAQSARQFLVPTNSFRLGLTKGVELRVFNQLENNKGLDTSLSIIGMSDLEVGVKIQLLRKENVNTKIALISQLVLPTGTQGISHNSWGSTSRIAVSHRLSGNLGLACNVGYNYYGTGSGALIYSLVLSAGLTERLSLFAETYGEGVIMENNYTNFDTGIVYLVKDNVQLDFSFGSGLNYNMNFMSLGFSWNIKDKSQAQ